MNILLGKTTDLGEKVDRYPIQPFQRGTGVQARDSRGESQGAGLFCPVVIIYIHNIANLCFSDPEMYNDRQNYTHIKILLSYCPFFFLYRSM